MTRARTQPTILPLALPPATSASGALLAEFEAATGRPCTADDLAYLNGPWILHKLSVREEDLPTWARQRINLDRALAIMAGDGLCSHLEVAIYLDSAWAAGPLGSHWLPITQYAVGLAKGLDALPADLRVETLDDHQRILYADLRSKIRQAVVRHENDRAKQARRAGRRASAAEETDAADQ